jgi:hypothetical protein
MHTSRKNVEAAPWIRVSGAGLVCGWLWCACSGCSGERSPAADPRGVESDRNYFEVLERAREKNAETLKVERMKDKIEDFHLQMGRAPSNLVELVSEGFIQRVPEAGDGMIFIYNPTNGVISRARSPSSLSRRADFGSEESP